MTLFISEKSENEKLYPVARNWTATVLNWLIGGYF